MLGLTALQFFIVSVAVFVVIYWITPRKGSWFPFAVLLVLLTVLAYNFTPNETDDLSRYFTTLDYFRDSGKDALDHYIEEGRYSWDVYRVMGYYFYFISRFTNNHIMPALTIFICYGSMFLIINKAANRFDVSKWYLFLGAMFAISTYWYYDTASGIRNGFAFALAILATYYHLVERKYIPLCYVLYIAAALSHSAGILPVLVVVATILTLNTSGKYIKYFIIFGIVGGSALIQYLATKTDNKFIQSFAGQAESHEASALNLSEAGTTFKVNIFVLLVLIMLLAYLSEFFINGKFASELKRFYKYSSLLMYFLIGCIFSGLTFVRFVRWILPIVGALIFMIGMQMQNDYVEENGERYCLYYALPKISVRVKTKPFVTILFIGFTAVHFWYLCNGSSLYWMHF